MSTYAVVTFGCRVNTADSLGIEAAMTEAGVRRAPPEAADLVLVNTCSVTAAADQGARQAIRRVARANPSARILVTGCYATRRAGEVAALPGVVGVVPNDGKDRLAAMVLAALPGAADPHRDVGDGPCGSAVQPGLAGRTAWTLCVQTGCDERCSYCVIPSTRGPGRSVPLDRVRGDVARALERGFREIVITGVHLGSYGRDASPPSSVVDLLRSLARVLRGVRARVRIGSLEPQDCTDEVIDVLAGETCFARHLHLPLQHASDRILADMRRSYRLAAYARTVDRVRALLPDCAIGSDVLVGFPGERDEDADLLCAYLEGSPLTHLHVFPYSDRPGTDAASRPGRIGGTEIRDRSARVRAVGARLQARFRESQVGRVHDALTIDEGSVALTGNYCKVGIPAGLPRNQWVRVRIASGGDFMRGEVVSDEG